MAITIQKEPSARNWSGNPIHYRLYSPVAAGDATAYFEIKIKFKRSDESAYSDIVTLPYYPVIGTAKIDIQHILDGLLEYELPPIPAGLDIYPLCSRKMTGLFYIAYREITTDTPDPAFTDVEPATPPLVIKGGISYEKWRGDNYWANYFNTALPFLTWQQSGRLASASERMYLAWLNTNDINPGEIKMRRKVVYTDGTVSTADIDCPCNLNDVIYFPTGLQQLELDDIFPDKKIQYWEMQVWDVADQVQLSELYRYTLDNRYDRNDQTFNYRNSLGGLDSIRIRGIVEDLAERKYQEQESIVQHNYFEGNFILPEIKVADSTELLVSKADAGFVNREEQDRLREIHFIRECWWAQQRKWLPIHIRTQSQKLRTSADNLWSLPIEFSLAHSGDNYYTPRSVNLADGEFTSPVLCSAIISALTAEQSDETWQVDWNLVSGAPVRYEVSTPAISAGAPQYTTDTSYTYPCLPAGEHVITVRPVCLVGGEYHYGAAQTITIENGAVCTPVGISGTPALPKALKDIPYSYAFNLTGSQPFTLDSVVKPSWMTIAIVDDEVQFSGTPTATAPAATVSFVVKNCSNANSVSFGASISVLAPTPGVIYMENYLSVGNITDLQPDDWYIMPDGTFPIGPFGSATGTQSGTTDPITVYINTPLTGNLSLYINGVITQTLGVSGTGAYAFDVVNILNTDQVLIILTP